MTLRPNLAPPPVLTALAAQLDCYRRLAKLAESQHEFVQQGQTEQLLTVLQQRQTLLEQIGGLEKTIGPAKAKWSEYLQSLPSSSRSQAESLMAETRLLLEQITAADRNDALVLQQRKLNLGKQIVQTQSAKTLNKSYGAAAYGSRAPRMDVQR